jgi:hypothetical protein
MDRLEDFIEVITGIINIICMVLFFLSFVLFSFLLFINTDHILFFESIKGMIVPSIWWIISGLFIIRY